MDTGYIVTTVSETHLKAIRRSIEALYRTNDLSVQYEKLLTLANQLDRHYTTAGVLFFNRYELETLWNPYSDDAQQSEAVDIDAKRMIKEIDAQLETFCPIKLESELFDLPTYTPEPRTR